MKGRETIDALNNSKNANSQTARRESATNNYYNEFKTFEQRKQLKTNRHSSTTNLHSPLQTRQSQRPTIRPVTGQSINRVAITNKDASPQTLAKKSAENSPDTGVYQTKPSTQGGRRLVSKNDKSVQNLKQVQSTEALHVDYRPFVNSAHTPGKVVRDQMRNANANAHNLDEPKMAQTFTLSFQIRPTL